MIPLFFVLCLSYSGGVEDNCTYQWEIISDRAHFEDLYNQHKTTNTDAGTVQGFTTDSNIYVYNGRLAMKVLSHEADHAICHLQNEDPLHCDMELELRDYETFQQKQWDCTWCSTEHTKPSHDVWRYI